MSQLPIRLTDRLTLAEQLRLNAARKLLSQQRRPARNDREAVQVLILRDYFTGPRRKKS